MYITARCSILHYFILSKFSVWFCPQNLNNEIGHSKVLKELLIRKYGHNLGNTLLNTLT